MSVSFADNLRDDAYVSGVPVAALPPALSGLLKAARRRPKTVSVHLFARTAYVRLGFNSELVNPTEATGASWTEHWMGDDGEPNYTTIVALRQLGAVVTDTWAKRNRHRVRFAIGWTPHAVERLASMQPLDGLIGEATIRGFLLTAVDECLETTPPWSAWSGPLPGSKPWRVLKFGERFDIPVEP